MEYYLLYDGSCGYCRNFRNVVCRLSQSHFLPVELGSQRAGELLAGLEPVVAFGSFHLVSKHGEVYSGGGALPLLISTVAHSRVLSVLMATATSRKLLVEAYSLVARMTRSGCRSHGIKTSAR